MDTSNILGILQGGGLTLFLDGGDLLVTPAAAITPEQRHIIREHKSELLDLLRLSTPAPPTEPATTAQDTPQATDLDDDDYQERARIIEFCGGVPRQWAEGLATLCVMPRPSDIDPKRWLAIINAAAIFADQWAVTAAKLGWTVQEVFGVHQDCPARRFDAAGLLMALADPDKTLVELTQDEAIFEVGRARIRQTKRRSMIFSNEQRLLWE